MTGLDSPQGVHPEANFDLWHADIFRKPDQTAVSQLEPDAPTNRYLPQDFAVVNPGEISRPGDHGEKFLLEGHEREFEVHTPKNYDGSHPVPVFFAFHGVIGSIEEMKYESDLNNLADDKGFAVVWMQALRKPLPGSSTAHDLTLGLFPKLYGTSWNSDHGMVTAQDTSYDDLDYVKAVNGRVFEQLKADPHRLYAVGFSEGGTFAQYVQERLKLYAGVATVKSTHLDGDPVPDKDASAAFISILGDDDNVLALHGGHGWFEGWRPLKGFVTATFPKIAQSEPLTQAPLWVAANGCATEMPPLTVDTKHNDVTTWQGCNAPVEQIVHKHSFHNWGFQGGQHAWDGPGADRSKNYGWWAVREPDPTQNDSQVVVDFLLKNTKQE
jgi:polyhydroxybutyrate depolymerase